MAANGKLTTQADSDAEEEDDPNPSKKKAQSKKNTVQTSQVDSKPIFSIFKEITEID